MIAGIAQDHSMTDDMFEDSRHKSKEKSECEIPIPLKKRCLLPKDIKPISSRSDDAILENAA